MKKIVIFICLVVPFSFIFSSNTEALPQNSTLLNMRNIRDSIKLYYDSAIVVTPADTVTLEGKFLKEQFFNKAGREIPGVFDWFFETIGNKYFVKIRAEDVTTEKLEIYKNELLHVRGLIFEGLWDTDNPDVQSRVGKYIVILQLIP